MKPTVSFTLTSSVLALTTYMGHRDARTGYWYLEATPALFTKIAERCEVFAGGGSR
jgi:hypothetical protein